MGVAIRRAGEGDREAVTRLLDEAFQNDPVSSWVFPDAEHRRRRHPLLMGAFVDAVLAEGYVDVTEDGSACALWLSMPAEPTGEDDEDGPAQMREEVDPENERVELIGRLTAGIHPEGQAHEYLWMIAVAPGRQGEGLGSALVQHVLDRCDGEGVAAYLEASSARSRGLYERLGFAFTGSALELPDGPSMWPMWRDPSSESLGGAAGS
ncbi:MULTISPECIES: GNAT family N-acetyltransferase [unclassified Streptomyces]|jgi:GNAT superfamily N-acetyltransferase|uniref:GNAT family N-acetyltransferase n=1 Tax=unclassified Streptomyces TaxID=2593676 RepID=UPI00117D8544|nr:MULTISPECIES: GNAT family N-acetyltransferase [unclassified Streptomyces]TRO64718.1 GNAT family N-acetyltransferase [Streptomyces sp. IB201691-2A2]